MMTGSSTYKAVILAAGLGSRMRHNGHVGTLSASQAIVADTGVKAMIPFSRPFLDYSLSILADAGFRSVCLVTGPTHEILRNYYSHEIQPERLKISFAIQREPLGTANAILAAEEFTGDDLFLMVNSDNLYPLQVCESLRRLMGPGLAAFNREAMLKSGNIPPERIEKFAVAQITSGDLLRRVIEKPDADKLRQLGSGVYLSMNCWIFDRRIFAACRSIHPSRRGEFEITDAVQYAMDSMDVPFEVIRSDEPVLDLSTRMDIPTIEPFLDRMKVHL